MAKTTTLRIMKGIELSDEALRNLKATIGPEVQIEICDEQPDLERNYKRRADIFFKAMQLIMEAIPHSGNDEDIQRYIQWCFTQFQIRADMTVDEFQFELATYTAYLADSLVDFWGVNKHQALKLINKAEQYVIMQEGRGDTATISRFEGMAEGEFILQWDKHLPSCPPETLRELNIIKNNEITVTPPWFGNLPDYQQIYFQSSGSYLNSQALLRSDLSAFETKWKNIKKIYGSYLYADFAKIINGDIPVPGWFLDLSPSQQSVIKALLPKATSADSIDKGLRSIGETISGLKSAELEDLQNLRELPYWFLVLAKNEQLLLKTCLFHTKKVEDAVAFLSSRLRTIPGLANFAEHNLLVINADGTVKKKFAPRLRSSHLASRDVEKQPQQVRDLYSERDLEQICQHQAGRPLLVQTLISPFYYADIPDYELDTQRIRAIKALRSKTKIPIYTTNHPFNVAKLIIPTSASNPECLELLNASKDSLLPGKIKEEMLTLTVSDPELISSIASDSIAFTTTNNPSSAFAKLSLLIKNHPLPLKGLDPARIERLVKMAFIEAEILHTKRKSFKARPSSNEEENTIQQLTQIFLENYGELSAWRGWQKVLSHHYYLLNQDNHEPVSDFITNLCDLAQLSCDYDNLLNSGWGTSTVRDYYGRELWLSSLENLQIIHQEGISYGSCVSGKDRKSLELIHTDAMLLYRMIYQRWPSINDIGRDRANFVYLVAHLYMTRHGHELAGENAPGAAGIKTPYKYFPADIVNAINERLIKIGDRTPLKADDILATNNEVDRITNVNSYVHEDGFAKGVLAAMRLSEKNRMLLLQQLKIIVEEKPAWQAKKGYSLNFWASGPTGIAQIRDVLKSDNKSSIAAIAKIYDIVLHRPSVNDSSQRDPDTQKLYDSILTLRNNAEPDELLAEEMRNLNSIKLDAFKSNHYSSVTY